MSTTRLGSVATGVDIWSERWQYAQTACESRLARLGLRATFRKMDAARLEFPDASFDLAVSVMCFHEVQPPSDATLRGSLMALSEALRVLRPGGAFVFVARFVDAADFGDEAKLAAVLRLASEVRRESAQPPDSSPCQFGRRLCSAARDFRQSDMRRPRSAVSYVRNMPRICP